MEATKEEGATLVPCAGCGTGVWERALQCPACGRTAPGTPEGNAPPTEVRSRKLSFVLGILLIPFLGIGFAILLALLLTKTRIGPCPYCAAPACTFDETVMKHEPCGNLIRRRDRYVFPANHEKDAWTGKVAVS